MKHTYSSVFRSFCVALIAIVSVCSCRSKQQVHIGFITSLQGRYADIGTNARYGVMLACEHLADRKPVIDYSIELMDDRGNADTSLLCAQALAEKGIRIIIGPLITASATKIVPYINEKKILTVGPVIAGENLAGKQDYFIRLYPSTKEMAEKLAGFAVLKKGIKRFAAVYDTGNKEYSELWYANFKTVLERSGGSVAEPQTYRAGEGNRFSELARKALAERPEGVFIVASGLDAAILCHQIRKESAAAIFLTSWSSSNELISTGGKAVEGVYICQPLDVDSTLPSYLRFKEQFEERCALEPDYVGMFHYEAMMLLDRAIRDAGSSNPDGMLKAIAKRKTFQGVQSQFTVDEFGDTSRTVYVYQITDARYTRVE